MSQAYFAYSNFKHKKLNKIKKRSKKKEPLSSK